VKARYCFRFSYHLNWQGERSAEVWGREMQLFTDEPECLLSLQLLAGLSQVPLPG
jgi:hypothetical protein